LVLKSRFPSLHDTKTRHWGKVLAKWLAKGRWEREHYHNPRMLRAVTRWARVGKEDRQQYGHLRPATTR